MNFDTAFKIVLELEGGISNDPDDRGGLTKYGISQKAYPDLDIINLTIDKAKEIYKRDYWDKCRCDLLCGNLGLYVFDCAVNQGVISAIKLLQQHLKIDSDGIIGQQTINAIKSYLIERDYAYLTLRQLRYMKLDKFDIFGVGWTNRLFKLSILGEKCDK